MEILPSQLRTLCPNARLPLPELAAALNEWLPKYGIDSKLEICAFLAQAAHETAGFRTLTEYGNDAYFKRYNGRADLGNTKPNDGPTFRGRGIFQITGRANYRALGQKLGIDLEGNPELAAHPVVSVRTACEYWKSRNLSALAEKGDFLGVTKKINGGLNGLKDRQEYYRAALQIFQ